MNKLLLSVAFATLAIGTVQAADPIMDLPPVVVAPDAYDWSGFYVGVHGGGAWGNVVHEVDVAPPGPAFVPLDDFGVSGWLAGVQAGANMQSGKFVLGIEGRAAWVSASGNDGIDPLSTFDANWSASALVKAGVALGEEGKVLPYVIGGVTGLNYDLIVTSGAATSTANATAIGGSVGAGIEFAVGERVSIFAEYLHTFYGNDTLAIAANAPIPAASMNVRPSIGTAKVGVNFHF